PEIDDSKIRPCGYSFSSWPRTRRFQLTQAHSLNQFTRRHYRLARPLNSATLMLIKEAMTKRIAATPVLPSNQKELHRKRMTTKTPRPILSVGQTASARTAPPSARNNAPGRSF